MGRSTSAAALTLAVFFITAGGYAQAGAENVIPGRITAATEVSGDLILEGTVVVEKTGVLVVAPGSRILARPSAGISVQGRLEIDRKSVV